MLVEIGETFPMLQLLLVKPLLMEKPLIENVPPNYDHVSPNCEFSWGHASFHLIWLIIIPKNP